MSAGRYIFGGQAVAVSTIIRRIGTEPVHLVPCFEGSVGLADTGGCSRSHSPAREISYPGYGLILSFESASASISGDYLDQTLAFEQTLGKRLDEKSRAQVIAKTRVTELNVQNRLHIDHLTSQVTATFHRDANRTFSIHRQTRIDGVIIDGKPLTVHFNFDLPERDAAKAGPHSFQPTTIVERLTFDHGTPDSVDRSRDPHGNSLFVKELGTIVFGEVLPDLYSASLTLLRLKLGSPCGCDGSVGYSKPGGIDV